MSCNQAAGLPAPGRVILTPVDISIVLINIIGTGYEENLVAQPQSPGSQNVSAILVRYNGRSGHICAYTGGQKSMSFSALQPAKKQRTLTSGVKHTGHRSPPPCLHEPLT